MKLNEEMKHAGHLGKPIDETIDRHDYTYVHSVARIAAYDDLLSAPRITEILPAATHDFIEKLSSSIYTQAKEAGGSIPYTVIREVSENFIHARFTEVTVSILDNGNTVRFADHGPGITQKEKAQLPGFSSAIEPMKQYIRGVGSGLPIVKEYLDISHGTITIEDNLETGSVITISLASISETPVQDAPSYHNSSLQKEYPQEPITASYMSSVEQPYQTPGGYPAFPPYSAGLGAPITTQNSGYEACYPYSSPQVGIGYPPQRMSKTFIPPLSQREYEFLSILLNRGALGVTDMTRLTDTPQSTTHATFSKLEKAGLIEKTVGQKRVLTDLGYQAVASQ